MNGHLLTLTEAAKAVGRTRQALHGAISKGKLSASKDPFGQWQVDASELYRVYRPVSNDDSHLISASNDNAELEVMRAKMESQAEIIRELRNSVDNVRAERDNWMEQAQALARMLPGVLTKPEDVSHTTETVSPNDGTTKRVGFWARLFLR